MNKMINSVSQLIFGVGVVDILEQITWSEEQAKQADNLANKKNLQAAVDITVKILERWSKSPIRLKYTSMTPTLQTRKCIRFSGAMFRWDYQGGNSLLVI
jgi:hypothetical protein